ncbi:YbgA family protein [Paraferrimonas haliotis]|uniref:DUF1722 domain-containing protein n=1 Tax=Paraferrimonas haliotis TaxID=2013866 RepID=A0AA37TLW8_9GAMM|nr:DUF523 and DUF1722 domain-containing protein [Paraferrimonas haliotis]GLS83714.1 hypothetical protein GCM10007894_16910 [Paraferrimonas haliotis]
MGKFNPDAIQVGISSCLLGEKVRFDGGHKQSRFCQDELSQFFSFQSACPEMAIGMGTPRQTIRLVDHGEGIKLQSSKGDFDVTEPMTEFSDSFVKRLGHLSGYIFCAKSPSCGMERVKVYHSKENHSSRDGIGIFADAVMRAHPLLPCEEDGRLNDPVLRENFVTRVFAYHEWQSFAHAGITAKGLYDFHARYKYMLMAHNPKKYYELGPMLANSLKDPSKITQEQLDEVGVNYVNGFMDILSHNAKRRGHANTLNHIQGYFKRELSSTERVALAESIDKYRRGMLPLMAPVTLIKHYLTLYPNAYIERQAYLDPHPEVLKLRYNH